MFPNKARKNLSQLIHSTRKFFWMKGNYPRWKHKDARSNKQTVQKGNLKDSVLPKAAM